MSNKHQHWRSKGHCLLPILLCILGRRLRQSVVQRLIKKKKKTLSQTLHWNFWNLIVALAGLNYALTFMRRLGSPLSRKAKRERHSKCRIRYNTTCHITSYGELTAGEGRGGGSRQKHGLQKYVYAGRAVRLWVCCHCQVHCRPCTVPASVRMHKLFERGKKKKKSPACRSSELTVADAVTVWGCGWKLQPWNEMIPGTV